ncbi:MAG: hypothetical protein L6R35_001966 [Caloplaca aegaea]|nr:MAG: hypothetical protein L6R35_001966 [Caloplaca aegaea]
MAALKAALPAHLKSSAMSNGDADGAFHQKHHGKSQSHVGHGCLPWHVVMFDASWCE